jgi:hypothetical protein
VQREHVAEAVDGELIKAVPVGTDDFRCEERTTPRANVQLTFWVSAQIVIPRRVATASVVRRNEYHVITVSEVGNGNFSTFAATGTH